jgi:hypothetical protein
MTKWFARIVVIVTLRKVVAACRAGERGVLVTLLVKGVASERSF